MSERTRRGDISAISSERPKRLLGLPTRDFFLFFLQHKLVCSFSSIPIKDVCSFVGSLPYVLKGPRNFPKDYEMQQQDRSAKDVSSKHTHTLSVHI